MSFDRRNPDVPGGYVLTTPAESGLEQCIYWSRLSETWHSVLHPIRELVNVALGHGKESYYRREEEPVFSADPYEHELLTLLEPATPDEYATVIRYARKVMGGAIVGSMC